MWLKVSANGFRKIKNEKFNWRKRARTAGKAR